MKIYEIFRSIQGESTYCGCPCTFIRLAGCNLQCSYCDTPPVESFEMEIDEIVNNVDLLGGGIQSIGVSPRFVGNKDLVEITGGEPLLQKGSIDLCRKLIEKGKTVLVETNGSLDIGVIPRPAVVVMDIKTPDSLMSHRMDWENVKRLEEKDEVKFVVSSRKDYDWVCRKIKEYRLDERARLLMSPVYGRLEPKDLACWILEDHLPVRFQLQLHKIIWGPDATGV